MMLLFESLYNTNNTSPGSIRGLFSAPSWAVMRIMYLAPYTYKMSTHLGLDLLFLLSIEITSTLTDIHNELLGENYVVRNVTIGGLHVLPLKVQVIYLYSHFDALLFYEYFIMQLFSLGRLDLGGT